jgi:hypothetical protein
MIDTFGCRVVGVDTSATMREMAKDYVNSGRFNVMDPSLLDGVAGAFDGAICVWVLQHSLDPAADIRRLQQSMKINARGVIINHAMRLVPARASEDQPWFWAEDGKDIFAMMAQTFMIDRFIQHRHDKPESDYWQMNIWKV